MFNFEVSLFWWLIPGSKYTSSLSFHTTAVQYPMILACVSPFLILTCTWWSKSHATLFLKHVLFVKKTFLLLSENKCSVILNVGNVHHRQQCMLSLSSLFLMQPGKEFLQWCVTCRAEHFVSILLMCADCFLYTCFGNPQMRSPKIYATFALFNLLYVL